MGFFKLGRSWGSLLTSDPQPETHGWNLEKHRWTKMNPNLGSWTLKRFHHWFSMCFLFVSLGLFWNPPGLPTPWFFIMFPPTHPGSVTQFDYPRCGWPWPPAGAVFLGGVKKMGPGQPQKKTPKSFAHRIHVTGIFIGIPTFRWFAWLSCR